MHCQRTVSLATTVQEQLEQQEPSPSLSPALSGAVRAGEVQGPLERTRAPIARCSVRWDPDTHTKSSLGPHNPLVWGGSPAVLPGPTPLSPILPAGCTGTQLPIGRETTTAFAGSVLQAGTQHCHLFFYPGQDQNKSVSPLLSSCYGHHAGHAGFPWPLCCHSAQTLASAIAIAVAAICSG